MSCHRNWLCGVHHLQSSTHRLHLPSLYLCVYLRSPQRFAERPTCSWRISLTLLQVPQRHLQPQSVSMFCRMWVATKTNSMSRLCQLITEVLRSKGRVRDSIACSASSRASTDFEYLPSICHPVFPHARTLLLSVIHPLYAFR